MSSPVRYNPNGSQTSLRSLNNSIESPRGVDAARAGASNASSFMDMAPIRKPRN